MLRPLCLLLLVLSLATAAWPQSKKNAEKIQRAETAFSKGDVATAEKLLREVIKDDPTSIEAHDMLGILLQSTRRYSQAAPEFARALELDDKQKELSLEQRRQVIDGQAVSYAQGGDLEKAKSLYLAALKDDPNFALFNYNLACVYAELHDLDAALPYLQKAWDMRVTLPKGMTFPDPRKDSSFKAYYDDPKFQEMVRNMVQ
ncbi:MAG TPA: tetratricopeptide repeat protein [Terriglobales bacterium]|nr:tetratricopeptide repeat protein [Terriglobales bacterium]